MSSRARGSRYPPIGRLKYSGREQRIDRRLAVNDLFFTARVTEAPAPADAYSYVATPLSSANRRQVFMERKTSL
jgi:hypothetical protein